MITLSGATDQNIEACASVQEQFAGDQGADTAGCNGAVAAPRASDGHAIDARLDDGARLNFTGIAEAKRRGLGGRRRDKRSEDGAGEN
ncbi:hypothetical protein DR046_13440 [Jannaschia formosa]|nr:hypothetical protein DR046_13440 [Jannaschia formosa]